MGSTSVLQPTRVGCLETSADCSAMAARNGMAPSQVTPALAVGQCRRII
jgi:hypothetical protein